MANAATIGGDVHNFFSDIFRPFGKIISLLFKLILIIIIGFIVFAILKLSYNYYRFGGADVGAKNIEAAAQEPRSQFVKYINSISPELAALWEGKPLVDTYSAEVERNENNQDLGVRIIDFSPTKQFFYPGDNIKLSGNIRALTLSDETEIEVFCSMEGYKEGRPIPAQLFGNTAQRNKGRVFKEASEEFGVNCVFPPDDSFKLEKQRTAKLAELIVVYQFKTKASQKIWFLDRNSLLALKGEDPFKHYKISDSQLDSRKRLRSKYTDGPLILATNIDLPQPLADNTPYELRVQLANNPGWRGNLEKLQSLSIELPQAKDLELIMEGEKGFIAPDLGCDFEYVTTSDEGLKVYELREEKLAAVNHECNKATLTTLALSEKECVDLLKNPTFSCLIKATRVPEEKLEFDNIRASADYLYKVTDHAVVEIRKPVQIA